jgi:hypothetical protein
VQLVRIQLRVPEYGWTTQKVFHLLNALVCSLRCGSFLFRGQMQQLHPDAVRLVLFDLPGKAQACSSLWGHHDDCILQKQPQAQAKAPVRQDGHLWCYCAVHVGVLQSLAVFRQHASSSGDSQNHLAVKQGVLLTC